MPLGAFRLNGIAKFFAPTVGGIGDWSLYDGSLNGSTTQLATGVVSQKAILIDENKVLICYVKTFTAPVPVFARVLTISDTTVTVGNEVQVFTAERGQRFDSQGNINGSNHLFATGPGTAVLLCSRATAPTTNGVFITVTGTTITTTAIPAFAITGGIQISTPTLLSPTRMVITGRAGTGGGAPAGARLIKIEAGDVRELSTLNVSPPGETGVGGFQFPKTVRVSETRFVLQGLLQSSTDGRVNSILFDCANDTLTLVSKKDHPYNFATGNASVHTYDQQTPLPEWTPFALIQAGNLFTFNNFKYETTGVSTVTGGTGTQGVTVYSNPQTNRRADAWAYFNDTTLIVSTCDNNNATSRIFNVSLKAFKSQSNGSLIGHNPVQILGGTLTGTATQAPARLRDFLTLVPLSSDRVLFSFRDSVLNGENEAPLQTLILKTTSV